MYMYQQAVALPSMHNFKHVAAILQNVQEFEKWHDYGLNLNTSWTNQPQGPILLARIKNWALILKIVK